MSTIQTSIMIHDLMSRQFHAMNMAMSTVIDSFQTLQDTTSKAIDVSALNAAQRELQEIEANYRQIENEIKDAANAQNNLNNNISKTTNLTSGLVSKVLGLAGAYLSVQAIAEGVKKSIALSDDLTNIDARLNLLVESMPTIDDVNANLNIVVDTEGLTQVEQLQQQIFEAAKRSYAPYKDMADLVGKLGLNARDAFNNTGEIVAFAELLNKQFSIAGTNAEGVASATLQLTQALGAGVLRGEEFNAIFEAAPTIMQSIADYMGVPIGSLKELASEGKITAEIVKNAMFKAADDIDQKFNNMPVTYDQLWTNFQNDALKAFQPVLQNLNEIANSERFQGFINSFINSLYILAAAVNYVLDIFMSIGSFIYDNWSILGPLILGIAGALGVLAAALIFTKLATLAVTAAQWLWNTAMAFSPITWIIVAIILLIALFYAVVAAINDVTGSSISATGLIVGALAFLFSFIYNNIALMINYFLIAAEFFVNVWKNPIYSVKRLFANLANNAIDMATSMIGSFDSAATNLANMFISAANTAIRGINWIIDALNKIPGIDIGKIGEISARTSITADLSGLKNKINAWVGDKPEDYIELPRLNYMSPLDNAMKAYNWGANLSNSFSGLKSNIQNYDLNSLMKNALGGMDGIKDALDKGNKAGNDTADNTKKLANSVDMLEEDLKYLRDIAERDVINRFTTSEIKVTMTNNNNINSEMDIDGMIEKLEEKVAEKLQIASEGVYA